MPFSLTKIAPCPYTVLRIGWRTILAKKMKRWADIQRRVGSLMHSLVSQGSTALVPQECQPCNPVLPNAAYMQCFRHFARKRDTLISTMPSTPPLYKLPHVIDDEGRCITQGFDQPWCLQMPNSTQSTA
ncbi:MAG: hypothetical protein Q9175_001322 [Cornicularia normoerica]